MSTKFSSFPAAAPSLRCAASLFAATVLLVACGGGGSGDGAPAPSPSASPATNAATASVVTPATGKTAWNITTPATFSLTTSAGAAVTGALSCSSDAPIALTVASDCSSLKGTRLGNQTITVSAAGVSAKATVKVIPQPQPTSTSGNSQYTLAVTTDGRVLAWGGNSKDGALGQGLRRSELASLSLPTPVKSPSGQGVLTGIVAASAGGFSALALTEDGEVYSWGNSGALGRASTNGDPLPGKVRDATGNSTLQRIVAVSVGDDNALALSDDGTVYSWGEYSGQAADPAALPGVVIGVVGKAVAVSAGFDWSAALLADGRVMTWGYGAGNDQAYNLGRGPVGKAAAAVPGYVIEKATGQPITNIVSISAGWLHGLALTTQGQIYAWGHNENGTLGQADDAINNRPGEPAALLVKAPGSSTAWTGVKMVAAGGTHSLAMDALGNVFSWGYSQNGELGDGANHPRVNDSARAEPVVNAAGIGQLSDITAIASGYDYSLALTKDGSLLIWGRDGTSGTLGQGAPVTGKGCTCSYVPITVKSETGSAILNLGPISYWPNLARRGIF
jgi:alpha-tubulin suppressor-like RCC1 family protein